MRSTPQHDASHANGMSPILVFGLHHAGPIEVAPVDGSVHVAIGDQRVYFDRAGADDLLHAVAEAMQETR